jgi:ribosomal protein S12 methylthiotransferase
VWVRLHYVYPYPHVDDVIPLMADGAILPYLDIPFQHAAPRLLRAMRRPARHEQLLERIAGWRRICPDLAIRSTFIVGFPGETEEDFQFLLDWLAQARIERAGCFKFEPVAGAAANELPGTVPEEVKEERWHRLMAAQNAISADIMAGRIGRRIEVLVDELDPDTGAAVGRSPWDAPEIDGRVFLPDERGLRPGDLVEAEVYDADDYDLIARRNGPSASRARKSPRTALPR